MFTIENHELSVSVLDPAADLAYCGSRYCVGGYIWQVTDATKGPLLSGPQYPDPTPDTFDGQGAPDMFVTALGADSAAVGDEVGVIGVGRVRRTSAVEPFSVRHNPEVVEFLPWQVARSTDAIEMQTEHAFRTWRYQLRRELRLVERKLTSRTEIRSLGAAPLPVKWFPHPFFPLTPDRIYCRFSIPVRLPETPGYYLNEDAFICQTIDYDWARGCYQALDFDTDADSVKIEQRHPLVDLVVAEIDFRPTTLPVWSNACTFSFEPYFEATLEVGQHATWAISYQF